MTEKNKTGPKPRTWTLDQIVAKAVPKGDCLLWVGSFHRQGYGMMRFSANPESGDAKMRTVHSVVAQLKYGTVPSKQSKDRVTRTCDEISCVNPDHIVIKTVSEIMMNAKQTGTNTRFNADEIRAIRKEYADNNYHGAQKDLAIKWGTNDRHMWNIVRKRLYKWVK